MLPSDDEQSAGQVVLRELRPYLNCAETAYNLLGAVFEAAIGGRHDFYSMPKAMKVTTNLLCRLSNDLKCAVKLTAHGYGVQAVAIVSSAYEIAYTIAYIGADDSRASRWLNHDNPTQLFMSVWDLTRSEVARLNPQNVDQATREVFKAYRQLCWAKHGNPLFQVQFGTTFDHTAHTITIHNGPETSEQALQTMAYALEQSVGLSLLAARRYAEAWLDADALREVLPKIEVARIQHKFLVDSSVKRWGSEDPFPGRW